MAVSSYKYLECIKLLELNSNLFARNSEGRLPRCIKNNFLCVIKSFVKDNPDIINLKDRNGKTPLYLVIQ